ncbi:MAG: B-box zinc finger protein [Myxococcaceae bacterium]
MSTQPNDEALCSNHPTTPASRLCARCGSFICTDCERRTRPDAMPLCPSCWGARSRTVAPLSPPPDALPWAGIALGLLPYFCLLSWFPVLVFGVPSIIVNTIVLVRSKAPELRALHWIAIVGLSLSLLSWSGAAYLYFRTR